MKLGKFKKSCWNLFVQSPLGNIKQVLNLENLIESSLHWLAGYYTPGSHVLVDFYWLSGEWYPREFDSAQYDTLGRLTRRGITLRGDFNTDFNKWYQNEIDSAQYDTWYPGEIHKNSNNSAKS